MTTFVGYRFHWTTGGPVLVERRRGRSLIVHPPLEITHYDWSVVSAKSLVLAYELIDQSFGAHSKAERWGLALASRWIAHFAFEGFSVTNRQVIQAVRALEKEATHAN